jgi:predicted metal-dependent peptidase
MSSVNLEKTTYNLLQNNPFFAHFLLASRVIYDEKGVDTAGCCIKNNEIHFIINTSFFGKLSLLEQQAVFEHEIMHVLLDHCGARGRQHTHKQAVNIAMDCAINQYVENLPDPHVSLKNLEKLVGKTLLPLENWEYYYEMMKDKIKEANDKAHDHDKMLEGKGGEETEQSEAQKELVKAVVKSAASKALAASKGLVPDNLLSVLDKLNKTAQVNWRQQLRNIVASTRCYKTKPTHLKSHRRFGLTQPGRKKLKTLVLGVCVDTSGSISNESFSAFMTEVYHIAKSTSVTYLIHADCIIQKVEVIKKGVVKDSTLLERCGNGGTAYQPAIDECVRRKCDAIIYLGDMDAADTPNNPGVPFIWARVGSSTPPGNFGKTVDII